MKILKIVEKKDNWLMKMMRKWNFILKKRKHVTNELFTGETLC